jgi:hypothetical protein
MFGAAIYFADSKPAAKPRVQRGCDVFITADVDMGRALVLESPANTMTLQTLRSYGFDSIKGRGNRNAAWEYVVFEAHRIKLISVEGTIPFIRPTPAVKDGPLVCTYTQNGAQFITQPWWHCRTCGLVWPLGCCQACFELCHREHDTYFEDYPKECYCDCGAGHSSHLGTSGGSVCTYAKHGAQYVHQPCYHCKTCGLVEPRGCCHACFIHCHNGHDAFMDNPQTAFCDCGASSNCQLTSKAPTGKHVCTYAQHGTRPIAQPWYHCKTCGLVGGLGCCQACFELCHHGHDASFEKSAQACYCNCGASRKCKCMQP